MTILFCSLPRQKNYQTSERCSYVKVSRIFLSFSNFMPNARSMYLSIGQGSDISLGAQPFQVTTKIESQGEIQFCVIKTRKGKWFLHGLCVTMAICDSSS